MLVSPWVTKGCSFPPCTTCCQAAHEEQLSCLPGCFPAPPSHSNALVLGTPSSVLAVSQRPWRPEEDVWTAKLCGLGEGRANTSDEGVVVLVCCVNEEFELTDFTGVQRVGGRLEVSEWVLSPEFSRLL